ncbi:MAG: hypothetical protein M0006_15450 [Magnetospirillum sp.]|nr:hypothetical protein [Magnetospirillum sp.]
MTSNWSARPTSLSRWSAAPTSGTSAARARRSKGLLPRQVVGNPPYPPSKEVATVGTGVAGAPWGAAPNRDAVPPQAVTHGGSRQPADNPPDDVRISGRAAAAGDDYPHPTVSHVLVHMSHMLMQVDSDSWARLAGGKCLMHLSFVLGCIPPGRASGDLPVGVSERCDMPHSPDGPPALAAPIDPLRPTGGLKRPQHGNGRLLCHPGEARELTDRVVLDPAAVQISHHGQHQEHGVRVVSEARGIAAKDVPREEMCPPQILRSDVQPVGDAESWR